MLSRFDAYELLWFHEDGNLYTDLKCPYEGEAELFVVYPNGFKIPYWFLSEDAE